MSDHDHGYKYLFSHARMVEDLLKGFVREEWVKQLDFSTLEKVNGSYVSDDLRGREDDIVWRVQWGKGWLYVYILLEFQSTVDPWMAVRIMTYVGLLYQDLIRTNQVTGRRKLPPVLPVVLYNGSASWTAATDMCDLVQEVPGGLSRYRPHLSYLLLAEREYCEEELASLNNLVAALFCLENGRSPEQLLDIVVNLLTWLSGPEQDSLRRAFTVWFCRVLFPNRFEPGDQPIIEELSEVKTMLAERVREWNREATEKGLRQGIQQGMQQGKRQMLSRLLAIKFGSLSPDLASRLNKASEDQLLQWSERILTAEMVEDVFGD